MAKVVFPRLEQRIGIVAAGYADGYPRHAPTGTPVLVDGIRTSKQVGQSLQWWICWRWI